MHEKSVTVHAMAELMVARKHTVEQEHYSIYKMQEQWYRETKSQESLQG
jgi:hypothetical protein